VVGPEAGQVPGSSSPEHGCRPRHSEGSLTVAHTVLAPPGQGPQGLLRCPPRARPTGVHFAEERPNADHRGIKSDLKRFKNREKAKAFVAFVIVLGQYRFASPDTVLHTDGSVSAARDTIGWGVQLPTHYGAQSSLAHRTLNGLGPTDPPTTPAKSKISALYYALTWVLDSF